MSNFIFHRQRAFTLIELLVVILIIAILVAVALPNFLGQQNKAHDSATTQELAVARKALKGVWIGGKGSGQNGYPSAALAATLHASEPQLDFADGSTATASTDIISVTAGPDADNQIILCKKSKSDIFFCLMSNELGQDVNITANVSLLSTDSAHAATFSDSTIYAQGSNATQVGKLLQGDPTYTPGAASLGWDGNVADEEETGDDPVYQSNTLRMNWLLDYSEDEAEPSFNDGGGLRIEYLDLNKSGSGITPIYNWQSVPTYSLQLCPDTNVDSQTFGPDDCETIDNNVGINPAYTNKACQYGRFFDNQGVDYTRDRFDTVGSRLKFSYNDDGVYSTLRLKAEGAVAGQAIVVYGPALHPGNASTNVSC